MVKRSLLIGINYVNDSNARLYGCINDVMAMHNMLIDAYGYEKSNITVLRDDKAPGFEMPTKMNIIKTLKKLISLSNSTDELWIHYSGHGSYIQDRNYDEYDRRDEILIPCDYNSPDGGIIVDDELKQILDYCKSLTYITSDCCHGGTGWDLPYLFRYNSSRILRYRVSRTLRNKRIYMLSGSRDYQEATDSYNTEESQSMGAFTIALIECLRFHSHDIDLSTLHKDINMYLKQSGYSQVCEMTSSNVYPERVKLTRTGIQDQSLRQKLTPSIIQNNMRRVLQG
jgi:hypothetical protein